VAWRKRILIIVENLPVPFDRRVWQEARALTEAGHRVTVICPKAPDYSASHEVIDGIEIFRHPLPTEARGALGYFLEYGAALFWQSWLALRVFLTRGFDAIHACNPPDLIFLVALPYKLLGKRFVFDHHDLNPELYIAKFNRRDALYRLLCRFERATFRLADMSIATNDSYREIAIARGGMAPEDVVVVRSGPDLARMRPVPPDPAVRGDFRHLVGYVGVMGKQEGISLLLESVRHIVHDLGRKDIGFLLVGSGPELDSLRQEAAALKVAEWVTFTGRVPDADMLRYLCSCDVCVNPDEVNALNDLSTMNKILEYMALAKPVVQFDVKEGRFSAQSASLYAAKNDPRDFAGKILELLDDPERRQEMGAFARRRIEQSLSWDHEKPKLIAGYHRLFGHLPVQGAPVGDAGLGDRVR
jgi:glycosyltransferase involved in cell wall biosynthesis